MPNYSLDPNKAKPSIVMGFDFGSKNIGVAIGQSITGTANPLPILPAKSGKPSWQLLDRLVEEWQPQLLVIGEPLNMDGSEQLVTAQTRVFAKSLQKRYQIPIQFVDERLSTKEAGYQLTDQGQTKKFKEPIDSYAAVVILESWLQRS